MEGRGYFESRRKIWWGGIEDDGCRHSPSTREEEGAGERAREGEGERLFHLLEKLKGRGGEVSLKRETQHEGEGVDSGERECGDLRNTHQVG